jgi:hypothetical protein
MNPNLLIEAQQYFTSELPDLIRISIWQFRGLDPERREDAAWRAIEMCWRDFLPLYEQGRGELLRCCLSYAIRAARAGRDVTQARRPSAVCEVPWESLPYEVMSPRMRPDEEVQLRLDLRDWWDSLRPIDAMLAAQLGNGERTTDVAHNLGVSPGRISQRRDALVRSWRAFVGDDTAA